MAECAVCLGPVVKKKAQGCGHVFHARCIHKWWTTAKVLTCPVCRTVCYAFPTRASLVDKIKLLENTVGPEPGEFWPAWVRRAADCGAFSDAEAAAIRDSAWMSFDDRSFYTILESKGLDSLPAPLTAGAEPAAHAATPVADEGTDRPAVVQQQREGDQGGVVTVLLDALGEHAAELRQTESCDQDDGEQENVG